VINGNIYTSDDNGPHIQAFAVNGGKIIDVGSTAEIMSRHPGARVIDVLGNTVLPGIIDAHGHLMSQGRSLIQVDLFGSQSLDEVIRRLEEFVIEHPVPEGGWILGRGWDQNLWGNGGAFPVKEDLDSAFPDTPVYLTRVDGHASWCNSEVLRIVPPLPSEDPEGGIIVRDENGEPTGIFIDNAMNLVGNFVPPYDDETLLEALQLAILECNRLGITSVHDAGTVANEINLFKRAIDEGKFNIRAYSFLACNNNNYFCPELQPIFIDYGNKLTVRSVKLLLDGALGSWGAAMLEPYTDNPGSTGLLLLTETDFFDAVQKWVHAGYQVNTHAIGDRANRIVLDAYEHVIREVGFDKDLRLRIEHAQILAPEDIVRLSPLKIVASFQPTHATSDMGFAEDRVGPERIKGAYAWQSVAQTGARLALGSDFPVERINPFYGIHSAITRQNSDNLPENGWYPDQCLTIEQTVKGFTVDAAYAAFQDHLLGSITPGKWADFIIIDRDIFTSRPRDVWDTKVFATFVGGEMVYALPGLEGMFEKVSIHQPDQEIQGQVEVDKEEGFLGFLKVKMNKLKNRKQFNHE